MNERRQHSTLGDRLLEGILFVGSLLVFCVFFLLVYQLVSGSQLAVQKIGLLKLLSSNWDPLHGQYGVVPLIYGTLITSLIAVLLAMFTGVALAIVLSQYDWPWFNRPMLLFVDGLSAIPSVIYGLWGLSVLSFFHLGVGIYAAGVILALMVLPTIVSTVRKIMTSVPEELKQGALAIGATKEEMIHMVVLPYARQGILGSAVLGLTRAIGETIVIVMVLGHGGQTLTGVLVNDFSLRKSPLVNSSLFEVALLLCIVAVLTSIGGRLLVRSAKHERRLPT